MIRSCQWQVGQVINFGGKYPPKKFALRARSSNQLVSSLVIVTYFANYSLFFFSICRRYDEMSDKVSEVPDQTEALVDLQSYLREV